MSLLKGPVLFYLTWFLSYPFCSALCVFILLECACYHYKFRLLWSMQSAISRLAGSRNLVAKTVSSDHPSGCDGGATIHWRYQWIWGIWALTLCTFLIKQIIFEVSWSSIHIWKFSSLFVFLIAAMLVFHRFVWMAYCSTVWWKLHRGHWVRKVKTKWATKICCKRKNKKFTLPSRVI